ncbi:MAG: hypothetical protein V1897_00005 [Pseudomonadota bacterium]
MEKLFVILDVVKDDYAFAKTDEIKKYLPADGKKSGEFTEVLHLNPSRVIPASRLRYGLPTPGEKFFELIDGGGGWTEPLVNFTNQELLCLRPEPEPKSVIDEIMEECPFDEEDQEWFVSVLRKIFEISHKSKKEGR